MRIYNADEAMQHAETFAQIATSHADGDVAGTSSLLEDYYGTEHETAAHRLWLFAGVGPLVISSGIKKLAPPLPCGGNTWGFRAPDVVDDVHEFVLMQAVTAYLNDDTDAARDVITAHHAVHGIDGLYDLVIRAVIMAASLVQAGGILPLRKEN